MKKKSFMLMMGLITGLLFLTVGVLTATDVPDEITIENSGYKKDTYGPAKLDHKKHYEEYKIACTKCHHENKDMKPGDPVKKCSECHDPNKKQGKALKLKMAYHKNCRDCHQEMIAAGKASEKIAPVKKCTKCHPKK